MDLLGFTRVYLAANLVLLLAWLLLVAARACGGKSQAIAFRAQLAFGYAALIVALLMPLAATFAGGDYLPEAAQVWSGPSMRTQAPPSAHEQHVTMSFAPKAAAIGLDRIALAASAVLSAGALIALWRVAFGVFGALRIVAAAKAIRRCRSLRIVASDAIDVPFSFWIPGRHYVALPAALLASPRDLRLALRHEAQHHRQGDTKLLYGMQLLLGACFWNPAAYRFMRAVRELQEFVCDEAIVRRPDVSAAEYCRCLVRIAEQAREQRAALVCMGMADRRASVFFQRIEHMMEVPMSTMRRTKVAALAIAALAALSMTAVALAASIKDRRITREDAQRMATIARADSTFPIVVNDSVVQELNRYLGTPDGRKFIRDSFGRMQTHRELIETKLAQYGLPRELMAVPLVESGYRNLAATNKVGNGAGIWMFIAPTARRYDLRVDEQADERLNVAAETDAAMRMFGDLQRHFGDWSLALLAYNSGNALVERGIRETGSRDPWRIVGEGYENDPDYLPRVMAGILIMHNPEYVD